MDSTRALAIEDLARAAGVSVRTIRYYITEGLLPGPGGRGKGASYSEEHLLRLRLIRRLAQQGVPLAEQRERLARLTLADLRALLREEDHRADMLARASARDSPRDYISTLLARARENRADHRPVRCSPMVFDAPEELVSSPPLRRSPMVFEAPEELVSSPRERTRPEATWRRVRLAPGVELHVRADAELAQRSLIRLLLTVAGRPGLSSLLDDAVE